MRLIGQANIIFNLRIVFIIWMKILTTYGLLQNLEPTVQPDSV